jgi:CBS domain-containing protein
MKIRDVMTPDAQLISPDDTLRLAATRMKECDCGVLPVADGNHLVGMITDRDMAIRCIAEGKGADAKVRDAMTQEVKYCFEDEDCDHVAETMAESRCDGCR